MAKKYTDRFLFWVYLVYILFFIFWCLFVWSGCGNDRVDYPSTGWSIVFGILYGKIYYKHFLPWITGR